jgi:hypothetical protein
MEIIIIGATAVAAIVRSIGVNGVNPLQFL